MDNLYYYAIIVVVVIIVCIAIYYLYYRNKSSEGMHPRWMQVADIDPPAMPPSAYKEADLKARMGHRYVKNAGVFPTKVNA